MWHYLFTRKPVVEFDDVVALSVLLEEWRVRRGLKQSDELAQVAAATIVAARSSGAALTELRDILSGLTAKQPSECSPKLET